MVSQGQVPGPHRFFRALRAPKRASLIIIDDYSRHTELIKELRLGAGQNQHILLTSRTPTHLTNREKLKAALGEGAEALEFRIDTLTESELLRLDAVLAGAGLLGNAAAFPVSRRIDQIYLQRGAGEFGSILLWLLESDSIRKKLGEIFSALRGRSNDQNVIICAMVLTHIGMLMRSRILSVLGRSIN